MSIGGKFRARRAATGVHIEKVIIKTPIAGRVGRFGSARCSRKNVTSRGSARQLQRASDILARPRWDKP